MPFLVWGLVIEVMASTLSIELFFLKPPHWTLILDVIISFIILKIQTLKFLEVQGLSRETMHRCLETASSGSYFIFLFFLLSPVHEWVRRFTLLHRGIWKHRGRSMEPHAESTDYGPVTAFCVLDYIQQAEYQFWQCRNGQGTTVSQVWVICFLACS